MFGFGDGLTLKAVMSAVFLAAASLVTAPTAAAEKYASIVIDADTKDVLHARHADASRYPASLTKVMTLYMLFDALKTGELRLDDKLTVSHNAAAQRPSNLKMKAGQKITVRDAIKALVVKSANDVAVVVAERLGGSEKRFASLMTAKAKQMGMKNTRFRNASGLPNSRQRSTARDLSILAERMIEDHPAYYHYFQTKTFTWNGRTYKSHNKLLGSVDGVDGMKTGYIRASGFNLMTSAERDDRRIIVVMTGGRTAKTRNAHVEALVEAAFDSLDRSPATQQHIAALRTRMAFEDVITPSNPDDAAVPVLNGKPFKAMGSAEADEMSTEEPSETADLASAAPQRTIVASSKAQPRVMSVITRTRTPDTPAEEAAAESKIVPYTPATTPSQTSVQTAANEEDDNLSVSEYELRQFGSAGGGT